jgi:sugar phosphate isomerase/epimerase
MKLEMFRHLWGIDQPNEQSFPRIKQTGLYVGIECPLPPVDEEARFKDLLTEQSFAFIPMIFTSGTNVIEHLISFQDQLKSALRFAPSMVTAHSGADWFSPEDAFTFFSEAVRMEKGLGLSVAHETHRGRILFNPWITKRVLNEVEGVQLCADFSHWVAVCERLLNTEKEIIRLAAQQVIHIHSRVGYEEGPQVPDPRAPEYASYVRQHEDWWDLAWEAQRQRGSQVSRMTPEFGPPPYLHILPYTQQPVANLWDICNWQAQRQSERFMEQQKMKA